MNSIPKGQLTGRECRAINPSKRAEVYYSASVKHLISLFKLVVKQEINRENQQKNLGDASPDSIQKRFQTFNRIVDRFLTIDISAFATRVARNFAQITNADNKKRLSREFESVMAINPEAVLDSKQTQDFFKDMIGENVQLIKGLHTESLSNVQKIVQSMIGGNKTLREAGKDITAALNIQQNRGMRIAIDQSRKAMGDLTNLRMQKLGIKLYRWSAVMDKRKNGGTRPSHAAMHNKICRFDDPSVYFNEKTKQWEKRKRIGGVALHPSQDFNCRCVSKVILQSIEGLEDERQ
ncbi:MAG: phage minor head protein [Candidatus Arsenophonus phytopathogenicus]